MQGGRAYRGLERRRHTRHDVETTFWLVTPEGASLLLKSKNVSAGGALLNLPHDDEPVPAIGTQLRFVLTAVDAEVASEDAKLAEVVRTTPFGMAIRFVPHDDLP